MKAFIFDMDGTIFDTERVYYQTWIDVAKERNFYFDLDRKKELSGLSYEETIEKMQDIFSMDEETARDVKNELEERRNDLLSDSQKSLKKKGLVELLDYLKKKKKKIGLASSSPRTRIDFLLKKEGLKDYFDFIISGTDIKKGKPDPEIFEKAMEALKVGPMETYVIEDSYHGLEAANRSKAFSVFIPDLDDREELVNMSQYSFESLKEFMDHVKKEDMENLEARNMDKNRPMTFLITCDQCGHDFEVDLNTAFFANKSTKNKIFDPNFAKLTCPHCGHEFILNYRFVYTDASKKIMLVNDPSFVQKKNQLAFKSSLRLLDKLRKEEISGYKIRMCKTIDETREKIRIFDQGLDDRLIEIMKIVLIEADGFALDKEDIKEISFNDQKKFLIKTSGHGLVMDFVPELYQSIEEKYSPYLEESIAQMIDRDWALDFMKATL